jgi:YidC/Oxa1 family membrane protein insertase
VLALVPWQTLLNAFGWVLAKIYDVVPNYGLSIIILTLVIKLLLVPLGIRQIKSMQHMQAIQPKIKELQKKYKNNKAKQQEETMRLYKEAGVNPLGGCLPLLLQFPILIAMYAVIRTPVPNANYNFQNPAQTQNVPAYLNNHLPTDSKLYRVITTHDASGTSLLFMNLQCSLSQSGTQVEVLNSAKKPATGAEGQPVILDCGDSKFPDVVPYALLLVVMVASTFYQQQQMQKASPPGAQSSQQQQIMRFFPLMFAFLGLTFPSGLVLYWTLSNLFQVGQQTFLMRAGHIGPEALERRISEQRAKMADKAQQPPRLGFMARMAERAEEAQKQRERNPRPKNPARKPPPRGRRGRPGSQRPQKPPTKGTQPKPPKSEGPNPRKDDEPPKDEA